MKHLIKRTKRCDPGRWRSLCGEAFPWAKHTNASGPEEADCHECLEVFIADMDDNAARVERARERAVARLSELQEVCDAEA